ncbi:MAG TPA: hypothetical protein VNN13_09715 [Methylomirabilota bacterium]|nr:hypothetical protein [Methylomirabilota bacterium]
MLRGTHGLFALVNILAIIGFVTYGPELVEQLQQDTPVGKTIYDTKGKRGLEQTPVRDQSRSVPVDRANAFADLIDELAVRFKLPRKTVEDVIAVTRERNGDASDAVEALSILSQAGKDVKDVKRAAHAIIDGRRALRSIGTQAVPRESCEIRRYSPGDAYYVYGWSPRYEIPNHCSLADPQISRGATLICR